MSKPSSGTGKGGKSFQDRELAARVRTLTMERCEKVLSKGKGRLYEAILLRLAGQILPRINEHSGPEGGPIVVSLTKLLDSAAETDGVA